MPMDAQVNDDPDGSRFALAIDGKLAFAEYQAGPGTIEFTHTFVPPELRGQGIATRLVEASLASARERGLTVTPSCAMFAQYMKGHPETHDLLGPDSRRALAGP